MTIPRATYRLQFHEKFRLPDALLLVPYLHELGISHIYSSPLFAATPHSTHGYDVCDFSRLNPELGTEQDLENLAQALHEKKMGLVLDLVPNHMGIGARENQWWWDVLTHGPKSRFARHFDIDWKSSDPELYEKILIPILGDEYEKILSRGELQIHVEADGKLLGYHEHRFPLTPKSAAKLPSNPDDLAKLNSNPAALDQLIRRQNYILQIHSRGDSSLNYRRFFAISTLAGVRVEDPEVFEAAHVLLRKWIAQGWIDGLRVDHPDGLRDPKKYLEDLRRLAPDAWIVVEKILCPGETLPASWPVAGTTGYDFLNIVNGVQVDSKHEQAFTHFYADFTGEPAAYARIAREKKRVILKTLLLAEFNRLANLMTALASAHQESKNLKASELTDALSEVIVHLSVYRSYLTENRRAASVADISVIQTAVHLACEANPHVSPTAFALISSLLLEPARHAAAKNFVARLQQLTGPVMAKSVEDTAFYCFNRFVSLNEVGGDPKTFGVSDDSFHKFFQTQQKNWPHSQLTTSTHDTKRAEDVRARLNVLSEIPETWMRTVRRWSAMNACHRKNNLPDRNLEYLFYQTLAGAWPLTVDRAQFFLEKAAHESKQHTTWTHRNQPYEEAMHNFVSETLRDPQFTTDLEHFVGTIAPAGEINSLAQTLIKLTAPGVPDIYQGCEAWDFSLVDPDNRRPVDFAARQQMLADSKNSSASEIWARRAEGLPKLWLIKKTLALRARLSGFPQFDYKPVHARGSKAAHVLGFSRGDRLITIVSRWLMTLNGEWEETSLELPPGKWHHEFTGEKFSGKVPLKILFQNFPVALLVGKEKT